MATCMNNTGGRSYSSSWQLYLQATGAPNDTAVVYTPAFRAYNDKGEQQVYVWNVTLPQHFFSRAPVDPDQRE